MGVLGGHLLHQEEGRRLLRQLYARDYSRGAIQTIIVGDKGKGKSTLGMKFALKGIKLRDTVIWRGRFRDIWVYLKPEQVVLFFHEQDKPAVWKSRPTSRDAENVTSRWEVRTYSSARDLLDKLEDGRINVVYEPTFYAVPQELKEKWGLNGDIDVVEGILWWFELFDALTTRIDARWFTIVFDEMHDLAPSGSSGAAWKFIERGQNYFSEMRDRYISFHGITHSLDLLDFRILRKFSWFIYVNGATPHPQSSMKVNKVTWLDDGEAIIDNVGGGRYGKITFKNIKRDGYIYTILRDWTGPRPKPKKRYGLREELLALAEEEGIQAALDELDSLFKRGEVSKSHYYRLKKELKQRGGEDV